MTLSEGRRQATACQITKATGSKSHLAPQSQIEDFTAGNRTKILLASYECLPVTPFVAPFVNPWQLEGRDFQTHWTLQGAQSMPGVQACFISSLTRLHFASNASIQYYWECFLATCCCGKMPRCASAAWKIASCCKFQSATMSFTHNPARWKLARTGAGAFGNGAASRLAAPCTRIHNDTSHESRTGCRGEE